MSGTRRDKAVIDGWQKKQPNSGIYHSYDPLNPAAFPATRHAAARLRSGATRLADSSAPRRSGLFPRDADSEANRVLTGFDEE